MLRAPFPWPGSKRRVADEVLARLGTVDVYVEPFAGSLACLLVRDQPARREIVCDIDGMVCNFWRSVQRDPKAVAHEANYPTIQQDLTARHRHLVTWRQCYASRLSADPEFYDPRMAAWWVWGISIWIGGAWCSIGPHAPGDRVPQVGSTPGGQGVSAQRIVRPDLEEWFGALQQRLQRVIVLNRSWESAVTRTMLAQHGKRKLTVGILMDPPYQTTTRATKVYDSDVQGESTATATASLAWALEHGTRFRIAYCMAAGDFEVPSSWTTSTHTFAGIRRPERRKERNLIAYSPSCLPS